MVTADRQVCTNNPGVVRCAGWYSCKLDGSPACHFPDNHPGPTDTRNPTAAENITCEPGYEAIVFSTGEEGHCDLKCKKTDHPGNGGGNGGGHFFAHLLAILLIVGVFVLILVVLLRKRPPS